MQILRGVYVDSFKLKKPKSVYFLTHWHADHYWGLTTNWQYGPIYCSVITRKILLTKYPKLKQITHGLELNQTHTLTNSEGTEFKVTLFDSNHIAGSVIILFQLADGTYTLHTGDMRFNTHCLQNNPELFVYSPATQSYSCRHRIDKLYLDNTYCDPIFMFPNRSDALQMIKHIIDHYGPGSRMVYLVTDSIGKEEAFVGISLCYGVPVTLWGERMEYVKQMFADQLRNKIFCTKQDAAKRGSWIEVIKRRYVEKTLKQDTRAIAIKLTGWANLQDSHPLSERQYIVPYSLHSNYQQLQLFMSVVRPVNLFPVVRLNHNKSSKFRQNIHSYGSYFGSLTHMKQRGFSFFASHYLSVGFSNKKPISESITTIQQNKIDQQMQMMQQSLSSQVNQMEQASNQSESSQD